MERTLIRIVRALGYAVLFGIGFTILGAIAGFVIGLGISAFDEIVLNKGNPQGPLLLFLTAPIGAIVGTAYGWIRGFRSKQDNAENGSSQSKENV